MGKHHRHYDPTGHYFEGGNLFERILRFFNLLEPKQMVLSVSKIAVYSTLGLVFYAVKAGPGNIELAMTALAGLGVSTVNYGYRRYMQYQEGNGPYPTPAKTDQQPPDDVADAAMRELGKGGPNNE